MNVLGGIKVLLVLCEFMIIRGRWLRGGYKFWGFHEPNGDFREPHFIHRGISGCQAHLANIMRHYILTITDTKRVLVSESKISPVINFEVLVTSNKVVFEVHRISFAGFVEVQVCINQRFKLAILEWLENWLYIVKYIVLKVVILPLSS